MLISENFVNLIRLARRLWEFALTYLRAKLILSDFRHFVGNIERICAAYWRCRASKHLFAAHKMNALSRAHRIHIQRSRGYRNTINISNTLSPHQRQHRQNAKPWIVDCRTCTATTYRCDRTFGIHVQNRTADRALFCNTIFFSLAHLHCKYVWQCNRRCARITAVSWSTRV